MVCCRFQRISQYWTNHSTISRIREETTKTRNTHHRKGTRKLLCLFLLERQTTLEVIYCHVHQWYDLLCLLRYHHTDWETSSRHKIRGQSWFASKNRWHQKWYQFKTGWSQCWSWNDYHQTEFTDWYHGWYHRLPWWDTLGSTQCTIIHHFNTNHHWYAITYFSIHTCMSTYHLFRLWRHCTSDHRRQSIHSILCFGWHTSFHVVHCQTGWTF